MENKKYFLSLLIIVLVLFLGVGYAVVSSVYIKTGGTANVSDYELNVEITNAVASTNVTDKTVDFSHVLSNKNLTSNFTLNGMTLGEVVTITYTVTNNEKDVDTKLSSKEVVLVNSNLDYFNVSYNITDSRTDLANGDKIMTVDVIVELIKTPVTEENGSTMVDLTITASPYEVGSEVPIAYSYNGVELSALPEYDTEMYPYAVIYMYSDNYFLLLTEEAMRIEKYGQVLDLISANEFSWTKYKLNIDQNLCKRIETLVYPARTLIELRIKERLIWSNYDIYSYGHNFSGVPELYFVGSEPVPVYE